MNKKIKYGKKEISIEIANKNYLNEITPKQLPETVNSKELVKEALANPVGTPCLSDIIKSKSAKNAVIVVNDITRPTPYDSLLPPLLNEIESAGINKDSITIVVALGIHRPHSNEDNVEIFGNEICSNYKIENHNCDENLSSLGFLSNGMELIINSTVASTDLLITTGMVGLHYFAGYSGGRKSILPGIAGRKLIEANHKMMDDERARLGNYEDNPVNDIMLEAAGKVGVDFILNVVTVSKKDIAFCVAGDLYEAWIKAVKYCEQLNVINIPERAEIVIAGCGGYPKDINMYQAQKALDAASLAVKENGTIILIAECIEGLGEDTFQEWIESANCPQDIVDRFYSHFELGGHKAYAICRTLKKADILLCSELEDEKVKEMFMQPAHSVNDALEYALNKHGDNAKVLFMPEAPRIAVKPMS